MLSRIEFFVKDNKVGEALRNLAGLAVGDPKVQPVVNGAIRKGKVVATNNGETVDMFLKYAKTKSMKEFTPKDLRAFAKSIGKSESSATYLSSQLVKNGVVKRTGNTTNTRYTLVQK